MCRIEFKQFTRNSEKNDFFVCTQIGQIYFVGWRIFKQLDRGNFISFLNSFHLICECDYERKQINYAIGTLKSWAFNIFTLICTILVVENVLAKPTNDFKELELNFTNLFIDTEW
jgi:hypothetical protein